jgi:hypothetical protein
VRVKNIIRAVACLAAALFFCLPFVGRATGGRAGAQAGVQGDRPVEQTRKNIQVLKGLPSSRLFEVMNFVSVSLGVHCQYCHVKSGPGGDDWVWESDDKPTKRAARRMMQMVLETNKNNLDAFRGAGVTCYTCHRGATTPERFPPMPLTVSGHEGSDPAAAAVKSAAEATPTAEQVLSRYVDAVGGRSAVARLKTRVLKGTRDASQGRSWPMELNVKEPGKYLMVLNIPEQGELRRGADGARGWVRTRGVAREMTPAEVESLRDAFTLSAPVAISEPFPQMTPAGLEKIGERAAYVLEHRPSAGVRELYYFDRETGLLLRRKNYRDTVLFPVPEQYDFEDYRDVDGLKLPFTVRYSNIDTWFSFTRKFTDIKHNVPLDDALFSPPPAAPTPAPKP